MLLQSLSIKISAETPISNKFKPLLRDYWLDIRFSPMFWRVLHITSSLYSMIASTCQGSSLLATRASSICGWVRGSEFHTMSLDSHRVPVDWVDWVEVTHKPLVKEVGGGILRRPLREDMDLGGLRKQGDLGRHILGFVLSWWKKCGFCALKCLWVQYYILM